MLGQGRAVVSHWPLAGEGGADGGVFVVFVGESVGVLHFVPFGLALVDGEVAVCLTSSWAGLLFGHDY